MFSAFACHRADSAVTILQDHVIPTFSNLNGVKINSKRLVKGINIKRKKTGEDLSYLSYLTQGREGIQTPS